MASFKQRWALVAGVAFITFLMLGMQHDVRCPSLSELWLAEKEAGNDPLPSLMAAAGINQESHQDLHLEKNLDRSLREEFVELQSKTKKNIGGRYVPDIETLSPAALLNRNYVPNTVFYIWCGRRWMEFHHYLSIKSVIQQFKPDNLIFYYDAMPIDDYWLYNTWFRELQLEYPFFRLRLLGQNEKYGQACLGPAKVNKDFVFNRLKDRGGMFVNEQTIIDNIPVWYRNNSLVYALDESSMKGFVMAKAKVDVTKALQVKSTNLKVKRLQCAPNNATYDEQSKKPLCVNTDKVFFPENIWELKTDFGKLARRIFYGTTDILLPEPSYDELIPNIAHLVWLGGGEMDFLFYLSILSLIYVAKVDQVYLHGDGPPTGPYWQRIKDNPKLSLIYRETPKKIFNTDVNVISHVTDIWRVDFMIRYGGIYVDTDTVFVKPMDTEIRGYDAVGSVDWTYWNPPFPDTINFGVAIGKRNATYWHHFQKSMKWWLDKDWSWNGLRQPYKVKERHPELVKIDPHLQVICYEYKCHPTWWPNYHNESIHHLNTPSLTDWHEQIYAFHWTLPTPPELRSEEAALNTDSMFSEIAKYILYEAGILKKSFKLKYTKFQIGN